MIEDEAEARRLEQLLLNSTQPASQIEYDGWLIRLAQDDVKRASSVNSTFSSSLHLEAKIAHCESLYAEHGLQPLFRLTRFVQPVNLDEALEELGYERFEASLSLSMRLDCRFPATRDDLRFEQLPVDSWLDLGAEMRGLTRQRQQAERERLTESKIASFPVVAWSADNAVACGLMMLENGYAGLFDLATASDRRREGIGLALCVHLMQLGREQGAERAWLSVVADNHPALRLYEKLGFAPVYDYWYRIKKDSVAAKATASRQEN